MNHSFLSVETTIREEQRGERNTRLHGRRLFLARVLWGVIAIFELAALVDSLTGTVTQLQVLCTSSCTIQQLSAAAVSTLQHAGLSLGDYISLSSSSRPCSATSLRPYSSGADPTTGWRCWSRSCS